MTKHNFDGGFLALREPDADAIRYFRESPKGLYQFSFVDFEREKPLNLRLTELEERPHAPFHFQSLPDPNLLKAPYLQLIEETIRAIDQNQWGKVVIARSSLVTHNAEPWDLFEKLVERYPQACVYVFSHPRVGTWMGASPEKLIYLRDNELSTVSLAGTLPLKGDYEFSEKEKQEQQMVTDYIFEHLHQEEALSEISMGNMREVEAGVVKHLLTPIAARTRSDFDVDALLSRMHPTPAVAGYPRNEALQYIAENEGQKRGYYAGYFGLKGARQERYWVNLRCMQLHRDEALLFAGGGITAQSDPESEWRETEAKMATLLEPLSQLDD